MSIAHVIDASEELSALAESDNGAALLSAMNAKTIQRTSADLQTARSILVRYGMAFGSRVLAGFKTAAASDPLLDSMLIALSSTGLNFSDPLTQQAVDALVASGAFTSEDGDALKRLGVWSESIADQQLGRDATEQDITDSVSEWRKITLARYLAERANIAAAAIADGTATSPSEVNAAFAGE